MIELSGLFDIFYGNSLELNRLTQKGSGINFVSRTEKNNGVSAQVEELEDITPFESGLITVSLGGSVLEAFVQPYPFYTGYHIFCLKPKSKMNIFRKLYYCECIRANKYRYNFGRQANRTLKDIIVPSISEVPTWIKNYNFENIDTPEKSFTKSKPPEIDTKNWKSFKYNELFNIERGKGPRKKELNGVGSTPFISASEFNNGLTDWTELVPIHSADTITVVRNGNSVANAFYQLQPFCSTEDVHVFHPKFKINKAIALFLCTLIKKEAYRFSYGRKWGIARMRESVIKLPVNSKGKPDWEYMENFIKSLPYSSQIF